MVCFILLQFVVIFDLNNNFLFLCYLCFTEICLDGTI